METSVPGRSPASSLWLVFIIIVVAVALVTTVMGWYARARQKAMMTSCLIGLKCMGTSFNMYASDWDDRLPPLYCKDQRAPEGKTWPDLVDAEHIHRREWICPGSYKKALVYSYNANLAGLPEERIDKSRTTILVFDSVNDSPENNNLNGSVVWHPQDGGLPKPGCYVAWPRHATRRCLNWPEWARPRHGMVTNVCLVDGHARRVEGWDPKLTMSPK